MSADVVDYIHEHRLLIRELVVYSPAGGPSRQAIRNPEAGLALAAEISAALRVETRKRAEALHLFQVCPLPLAVMIGHLWNRMPFTQLYDDLGPGAGYTPTFGV